MTVDFGSRLCDDIVPVARSTAACWLSNAIVLNFLGWSCGCHGSENFGFCSGWAMVLWWLESWILQSRVKLLCWLGNFFWDEKFMWLKWV